MSGPDAWARVSAGVRSAASVCARAHVRACAQLPRAVRLPKRAEKHDMRAQHTPHAPAPPSPSPSSIVPVHARARSGAFVRAHRSRRGRLSPPWPRRRARVRRALPQIAPHDVVACAAAAPAPERGNVARGKMAYGQVA
eukprot:5969041-Pleurochrysis_carterae.AAC.1